MMSPAAIKESHLRHHRALITAHGDGSGKGVEVTIGTRTYEAAVSYGRTQHVPLADGSGWEKMQNIVIHVRKDLVPTAPEEKTTVIVNSATYLIDEVGGVNDHDIAWVLRASLRTS